MHLVASEFCQVSSLPVTMDQVVMATLTAIIAFSAIAQAVFIRRQLEILRRTESREGQVDVVVQTCDYGHTRISGDSVQRTEFVGAQVINRSVFAVTISNWQLEVEQPVDYLGSGRCERPIIFEATEHDGRTLTTLTPPHRLERGDLATVMFSKAEVLSRLRRDDGTMTRVRVVFNDTLGNAHRTPCWIEWTEWGGTSWDSPSPGYITPEEARRS